MTRVLGASRRARLAGNSRAESKNRSDVILARYGELDGGAPQPMPQARQGALETIGATANTNGAVSYHSGLPLCWADGAPSVPDVHAEKPRLMAAKRAVDLGLGLLGLVLIAPVMIVLALAVRLTSKGPVLFVQKREGLNGELFDVYKFRSLRWEMSDHSGNMTVRRGDARLTPIGAFLRRTSFDELPQIFNIIKGDMSIVGPRPHVPDMLVDGKRFDDVGPYYQLRHKLRPGLTGWAQAHGLRGPVETPAKARARVDHDLAYIANISWHLDVRIIVGTAWSELVRLGRGG